MGTNQLGCCQDNTKQHDIVTKTDPTKIPQQTLPIYQPLRVSSNGPILFNQKADHLSKLKSQSKAHEQPAKPLKETKETVKLPTLNPKISALLKELPLYVISASDRGNKNQTIYLPNKKDIYTGQLLENNLPHGVGEVYFANGKYLKASFMSGFAEGHGRLFFIDGSYYQGFFNNNQAQGKGTYKNSAKKYSYEGSWKKNKPNGQGVQKLDGRFSYEGQFVMGIKQGKGILKLANGDFYQGNFRNNKFHGNGKLILHNKNSYQGEWFDGKMDGSGTYEWKNSDLYMGEYKQGKKHGQGQYSSGTKTFIGNWVKGSRQGKGQLNNFQKRVQGLWKKNKAEEVV